MPRPNDPSLAREGHLKRVYGITSAQYEAMLDAQDRRCPICLRHEDEFPVRLAVDHNHKTGEIRGLLCNYCNHRVVGRHTDGSQMRRVADYLDKGSGLFVPPKLKKPRKRTRGTK